MRSDKIRKYLGTGGVWKETLLSVLSSIIHDLSSSPSSLYIHAYVLFRQRLKFQLPCMRTKSYERIQPCNTMPKLLLSFGQLLKWHPSAGQHEGLGLTRRLTSGSEDDPS